MKYLLLLAFLFFFNSSHAQEYSFQLYSQYCDSIIELEDNYTIKDIETGNYYFPKWIIDSLYNHSTKPAVLPSSGKFKISSDWLGFQDIDVIIDQSGLTKHIIHIPKIAEHEGGADLPPNYRCCGKLCDGYNEDFYDNGQLRIKGIFKKGYAIKLDEYYLNGIQKFKLTFKNGYYVSKSYNNAGTLIFEDKCKTLQYVFYRDYAYKKYFSNGNLYIEREINNHFLTFRKYYTNGKPKTIQTKTKRKEYSENGQLKTTYKWNTITERTSFGVEKKLFQIFKSTYNENGKLTNTEEMTESVSENPQPWIAYTDKDSDYIN